MFRRLISSHLKTLPTTISSTPRSLSPTATTAVTVSSFYHHFSTQTDAVKKKVDDVMPIATGHEREEIQAELEETQVGLNSDDILPSQIPVIRWINTQKELSVSSSLTKADNLDPSSPKDPSCTKTKGDIGVTSRPKRTLVPAKSMLSKDLSTFDLFDESKKLKETQVGLNSDDLLPPGFEGSQYDTKPSQIPVIRWINTPKPLSHCIFRFTTISSALNRQVFMPYLSSLAPATRFGGIRCRWHLQGVSYNRWIVILNKAGGEGASIEEIVDCYIQVLAKVVGNVEHAKKKIFKVCCKKKYAFGCVIDEDKAEKLRNVPGVMFVLPMPNTYDFEHKDLGGGNYEMESLFPGLDFRHWLILLVIPGGKGVSDQEMVDRYIQILAKVVGDVEDAKNKIYSACCQKKIQFFGCEVDIEIAKKIEKLPEVLRIYLDSYSDPINKDYGAQLVVNGKIVKRSVERERLVGTKYVFHFAED